MPANNVAPTTPPAFVVLMNNAAANESCPICGCRNEPVDGPELFLAGTFQIPCPPCQQEHAPELARLRDALQIAWKVWRMGPDEGDTTEALAGRILDAVGSPSDGRIRTNLPQTDTH